MIDSGPSCTPAAGRDVGQPQLEVRDLSVRAGERTLLRQANFRVQEREVFGIIGPSGAGKSTLLRAINRLCDLQPHFRVAGDVLLRGKSVYTGGQDVNATRAKLGMLFQQPVIFPCSIRENVLFGARRLRRLTAAERNGLVEEALADAALWAEVKDRLNSPALALSVGQQQRLCLARVLATRPEMILMDEPTSALDPSSTHAIEQLILRLKERLSIVVVTHNVAQARRITDWIACVCVRDGAGEIVESACCDAVLDSPQCREVVAYLAHAM